MTPKVKHYPHGQCKATAKSTGRRCGNDCVPGFEVCDKHGGLTPSGANSPNFKHGRYSKHLPHGLLQNFNESLGDPELLDLRHDVALLDAVILEILEQMQTAPDAAKAWDSMRKALEMLETAFAKADVVRVQRLIQRMWAITNAQSRYHAARKEMVETMGQKRQTVAEITRAETAKQRVFTVAEVATLVAAFVDLARAISNEDERKYV